MSNNKTHSSQDHIPTFARRHIQPSQKRWHIVVASLSVCTTIVLLVATADMTLPWLYHNFYSGEEKTSINSQQAQAGIIAVQSGHDICEIFKFDNDTGRTIDSSPHCHSSVVLDARGEPVPQGTVNRLESISKSFRASDH